MIKTSEIPQAIRDLRNKYCYNLTQGIEPTSDEREGAAEYRRLQRESNPEATQRANKRHRDYMRKKNNIKPENFHSKD